jgi:phosphatidylserine decarboxylase
MATVFGFIARPEEHLFLKPTVTRLAARAYGFDFQYASRPNWETFASLLEFAATVRRDVRDLRPRDQIDLQSFIWVLGSDEYPD